MSFADQPIESYLEDLASGTVPPGGGTAAAVSGATGAALCELVCNNTIGHDDYPDVHAEMADVRETLTDRRARLLELGQADSEAIEALMVAYGKSEEEGRAEAIQAATKRATEVPLEVAEACLDVLERAAVVTERGNPNAAPDGAIGAFLADGALRASLFTVWINLDHVEDEAFVSETDERAEEVERTAEEALDRVRVALDVD